MIKIVFSLNVIFYSSFFVTARQTQISKRFIREVPRQMPLHDISAAECIAWVVLGGGPILYMVGLLYNYIVKCILNEF